MRKSNAFRRYKYFTEGRVVVKDEERQGASVMKQIYKNEVKISELVSSDLQDDN
jgi:hypothetical protein